MGQVMLLILNFGAPIISLERLELVDELCAQVGYYVASSLGLGKSSDPKLTWSWSRDPFLTFKSHHIIVTDKVNNSNLCVDLY